nr:50S ribosomal protein L24P [uncultured archaeon]
MKRHFSKHWNSSKAPKKQNKYRANAPLHIKRKFLSVTLSKELRKKYSKRNVVVRKGDLVKIMKGKFKKKQGKVLRVYTKISKVEVEGIQVKKMDGSNALVKMQPANLQILELELEDEKRMKKKIQREKSENKTEIKKEIKNKNTDEKNKMKEEKNVAP